MAFRCDLQSLEKIERTPSGGLRIPAFFAKTGIQSYHQADGTVQREYRPAEEVHAASALSSFRGAAVTVDHPRGSVTAKNWRELARGQVGDDVRAEGKYVAAALYVCDAETIAAIERGDLIELSAGYEADIDVTPGEIDGQRYDAIQRNIRGNHVALLPRGYGRAGRDVRLYLDSKGDQMTETGKTTTTDLAIEKLLTDRDAQRTRADVAEAKLRELEGASKNVAVQIARADAAEARVQQLEEEIKNAPARYAARVQFETNVRRLDGAVVVAGRKETEILHDVFKRDFNLTGQESSEFLHGIFAAKLKQISTPSTLRVVSEERQVTVPWQPFVKE